MDNNRAYETASGRFGTIVKSSGILGLKECMAIAFDDGTKGAFLGRRCSQVVCLRDGCDDAPVDLVGVWRSELKQDHADSLVRAFLALDAEGQEDTRKRWASTTKRSRTKFEI